MTPQQMANITGFSTYTLRYYEKIGLLLDIKRDAQGRRFYTPNDLAWIEFLKKLKATGMSLASIKAFANCRKQGDGSIPERIKLLESHFKKVKTELALTQKHLKKIQEKIKFYRQMQKNKKCS